MCQNSHIVSVAGWWTTMCWSVPAEACAPAGIGTACRALLSGRFCQSRTTVVVGAPAGTV